MLRAYAKKRGEAPLAPLHPATRRMLQDEVRRVHAPAAKAKRSGWAFWWPRLAFATSLCVVAVVTLNVMRSNRPPVEMAAAKPADSPAPEALSEARMANAPAADKMLKKEGATRDERGITEISKDRGEPEARQLVLETDQQKRGNEKSKEDLSPRRNAEESLALAPAVPAEPVAIPTPGPLSDAAASAPAPTVRSASDLKVGKEEAERPRFAQRMARSDSPASTGSLAAATPASATTAVSPVAQQAPAPAALRTEALARAVEMTNLGAALRTKFVQTDPAAALPVLRTFQMEQLGDLVRFVDFDGSVYTGQIQRATAPASNMTVALTAKSAVGAATAPGGAASFAREAASNAAVFSFTASGINRTLGAPVSLQGEYFNRTNHPAGRAQSRLAPDVLYGRTVVGGTNETPLRALSVER